MRSRLFDRRRDSAGNRASLAGGRRAIVACRTAEARGGSALAGWDAHLVVSAARL